MSFWKRSWSKRAEPKQEPVVEETGAEPMGEPSEALPVEPEVSFAGVSVSGLLPELKRLDRLLEQAVAAARAVYGTKAAADPFRGLHISQGEVEQLLARAPGVPTLRTSTEEEETLLKVVREGSRLDWLKQVFGLTPFEIYVILLSLAPELDLRYERIYAYLQDDVTRRRPSVDLSPQSAKPEPRREACEPRAFCARSGAHSAQPDPLDCRSSTDAPPAALPLPEAGRSDHPFAAGTPESGCPFGAILRDG